MASCGGGPKYFFTHEYELDNIEWAMSTTNYIPIMNEEYMSSPILQNTHALLKERKYATLKKYLASQQADTPDYYLAKTLYHISKNQYPEASANLSLMGKEHFIALRELIEIDLSYELAEDYERNNYKKFLNEYQQLLDRYHENEILRNTITLRVRHIRYNK